MHRSHQGVKKRSGLGDSFSSCGEESNNNRYPLCPKPRRIQPSPMPDFLNPLTCSKHVTDEKKVEILSLIPENKKVGAESISSCWCMSCCYSGSPPGRTENPLVNDVRFIREQMDLISHLPRTTHISDQFAFSSSASASPV